MSCRLAYLAGFFDGEGSIVINGKHYRCKRNGKDYYSWYASLTVANNCEAPIKMFAEEFGGKIKLWKRTIGRCSFSVRLISKSASVALEKMLPYLSVKAEQARLVIEFQKRVEATFDRRSGLSEEERRIRTEIQLEIRRLNGIYNARAMKGYVNAGESSSGGKWFVARTGGRRKS